MPLNFRTSPSPIHGKLDSRIEWQFSTFLKREDTILELEMGIVSLLKLIIILIHICAALALDSAWMGAQWDRTRVRVCDH